MDKEFIVGVNGCWFNVGYYDRKVSELIYIIIVKIIKFDGKIKISERCR